MNGIVLFRVFVSSLLLFVSLYVSDGHAAESGEFKGSWIANGTRAPFPFGEGRQVFSFKLAGHVNLKTTLNRKKDYWSECIGLADSTTGISARCVWKDLAGPEIYIMLQSDQFQQGSKITGTIVGGSGPLAGISGELSFNWSSVIVQTEENGIVSVTGETRNLVGSYRIP